MTLSKLLLKEKGKLSLYAIGVLIASVTNIIFTYGMSYAFGVLEVDTWAQVIPILLTSILIMISPAVIQLISRMLRIGFMADVLKELRLMAYRKIMNHDIETFNKTEKEAYQSAMISDINLFENDFFLSILNIGYTFFASVFSLILLFKYSWMIAAVALLTSLIQFGISKLFEIRVKDARQRTQNCNKTYNTSLGNMISGFKTIKSYASEHVFSKRFGSDIVALEDIKAEYFQLNKLQELISMSVSTISSMIIFFIASYLMYLQQIKIGDFIMVVNLSGSLVWGMISAIAFINRLKASTDIYYRLVDLDDDHEELTRNTINDLVIDVADLKYAYGDNVVIHGLDFKFHKNDKLLIHGPSGTGKTTLLNCLAQNISGYEGSIQVGGIEIKDIHHRDFLEVSAYVRQSHFMFDDSIRRNIIMNLEFDEEKFKRVLKQAAVYEWVERVGCDYVLSSNGSNISGGQRQRLSIARELYSDYEVIFIDEPSASLDDENAHTIYETILGLDKTVICVSHRHLDLLQDKFDHVISFEEGSL